LNKESKDYTPSISKFDISTLKGGEEDLGRSQISDFEDFPLRSPYKSPSNFERAQAGSSNIFFNFCGESNFSIKDIYQQMQIRHLKYIHQIRKRQINK